MCRAGNKLFRRTERAADGVIARLETKMASREGKWRKGLAFVDKADGKALRQDRRVGYLLTRSIQAGLEKDKLRRDHG